MEPVFMAAGSGGGHRIAPGYSERNVACRQATAERLQRLLVDKLALWHFYRNLPFEDPAFAAFQWPQNSGYDATRNQNLTRSDGWVGLRAHCPTAEGKGMV